MKLAIDFVRAKASLQIKCRNCEHTTYVTARFLVARLGSYGEVAKGKYICSKCKSTQVTLSAAAADAAERQLAKMQHFGGVYEKYEE